DWMGRGIYNAAKANPDGTPAIGVFEALDKLGLKLEAGKRPLKALVIDSVNETPTPNADGITAKLPTFPTEFDVAELRSAKPGAAQQAMAGRGGNPATVTLGPMGFMSFQNGRIEILGATMRGLINLAYNVEDRWIVNAPKWMADDRFDLLAKT